MQVNELRIGNYVSRKDLGNSEARIETVLEIYKDKLLTSGPINVIVNYNKIKPIPLTEEWLVNFGWIWNEETNSFEKSHLPNGHIQKTYFGWRMFNYVLKSITTNKDFFYVHQLQNLYFAITQTELTIK